MSYFLVIFVVLSMYIRKLITICDKINSSKMIYAITDLEVIIMNNAISDLWNGNIAPCEHCGSYDPAVNELVGLVERNRQNLSDGLTAAQMETFQKYIDCTDEYLLRMLELSFYDGFRLGTNLVLDAIR